MITRSNRLRLFSALGLAAVLAMRVLASASVANAQATVAILHSFTFAGDGATPEAGLIQGPDGTLYGTTDSGGASNAGVAFQLIFSPGAPPTGRVGHK